MSGIEFLDAAARQAALASGASPRPWPLPDRPWARAETHEWSLLAHWPAAEAELARLLPRELQPDLYDGSAWLGVVASAVTNLRLRGLPPLPGLSSLVCVEWRTYVTGAGRPGIWLLELDTSSRLHAEALKRGQRLPAYAARIQLEQAGRRSRLELRRDDRALVARFLARGEPEEPAPASLERFLCERYAFYTSDGGRLYRAEIQPSPWRLRPAQADFETATLAEVAPVGALQAHVAERQDLLVWPLEEL